MRRRSIRTLGAMLAIVACPCLAVSQGIPVNKFRSAADVAKATRLQRLTSGAQPFSLPPMPQGILGFYDPATKTFAVTAASPYVRAAPPQVQPMTPASGSGLTASAQTCPPPGHLRSCSGVEQTTINVNIVSPGIKAGDTVSCLNQVVLTSTKTSSGEAVIDNSNQVPTNFGVGDTKRVLTEFKAVYQPTHGGYAYLQVTTSCVIPTASDGRKYGPKSIRNFNQALSGLNSFSATFNF